MFGKLGVPVALRASISTKPTLVTEIWGQDLLQYLVLSRRSPVGNSYEAEPTLLHSHPASHPRNCLRPVPHLSVDGRLLQSVSFGIEFTVKEFRSIGSLQLELADPL